MSLHNLMRTRIFYLTGVVTPPVHLFEVRWNNHLVNYFSLMHHYGINTSLLTLTISRAIF